MTAFLYIASLLVITADDVIGGVAGFAAIGAGAGLAAHQHRRRHRDVGNLSDLPGEPQEPWPPA